MSQISEMMLALGQFSSILVNQYMDEPKFNLVIGNLINSEPIESIVVLIGPPRSGKTTILKMLKELFKDRENIVIFDDCDISKLKREPGKTYFCSTNSSPFYRKKLKERMKIDSDFNAYTCLISTKEGCLPEELYRLLVNNLSVLSGYYGLVCDKAFYDHFYPEISEQRSQIGQINTIFEKGK